MLFVVAAAMFDQAGRVLVQRRPEGKAMAGLWEFPGGKLEPGETPQGGLARELHEELGISVSPEALLPLTFASTPLADRHLLLLLFSLTDWQNEPAPLHAAALKWVWPAELDALDMPPADYPLIPAIKCQATIR